MGEKITIKQLMKVLGKSRGTIYNYMKDGMPCERKGRYVFFDLDEVNSWIDVREKGLSTIVFSLSDMFPGDILAQIRYMRDRGDVRTYIAFMAGELERLFLHNPEFLHKEIKVQGKALYNIAVAFGFAVERMDEGFQYVATKIENSITEIISEILEEKYLAKKFKTFFADFCTTEEMFEKREEIIELDECIGFFKDGEVR